MRDEEHLSLVCVSEFFASHPTSNYHLAIEDFEFRTHQKLTLTVLGCPQNWDMNPELWKLSWLQVTLRYLFEITASLWLGSFFFTRKLHGGTPLCRPMFRVIFRTRHGLAGGSNKCGQRKPKKRFSQSWYWNTNIYVPLNDPIWCKKKWMISPVLGDFFFPTCHGTRFWVLSGSSLRSRAPGGFFWVFAPWIFDLVHQVPAESTAQSDAYFRPQTGPWTFPKVGGPVLPGCWRMDVAQMWPRCVPIDYL